LRTCRKERVPLSAKKEPRLPEETKPLKIKRSAVHGR
jgi:hypothetical protein